MTTLVRAVGVTRRFGDATAVDAVDLDVAPGEVVGLIGPNGAGKTTLVRVLLGLLAPDAGRAELFGGPPDRASRARLGYVPQGLGLYDTLTVRENLEFVAATFGAPRGAPPDGIDPDTTVAATPLGARRRTAFAAALLHHPELLVLDEPTSGVDPLGRAHLWNAIREATERGAGALVTTHHLAEAEQCDRLVVLADGSVVATGTPDDLTRSLTTVRVRTDRWADAFDALERAGLPVALAGRDLRVPGADLDRVAAVLRDGDVDAATEPDDATLDEAFLLLGRPS